jgi:hypothetical protein
MLTLFLVKYKEFSHNKLSDIPVFKYIYFLIVLYFITGFYSVFFDIHMNAAFTFLKLGIILSVMYKLCNSPRNLDFIIYAYIFGSWYIGYQAWEVGRDSMGRVEGIGMVDSPDSNGTGAAIAPSLVFCLYYFWNNKGWSSKFRV